MTFMCIREKSPSQQYSRTPSLRHFSSLELGGARTSAGISKESCGQQNIRQTDSTPTIQYFILSLDELLYLQERFQDNPFTAVTFKNGKVKQINKLN